MRYLQAMILAQPSLLVTAFTALCTTGRRMKDSVALIVVDGYPFGDIRDTQHAAHAMPDNRSHGAVAIVERSIRYFLHLRHFWG